MEMLQPSEFSAWRVFYPLSNFILLKFEIIHEGKDTHSQQSYVQRTNISLKSF